MILFKPTPDGVRREAPWPRLDDDAPLPVDAPALVSAARWAAHPEDHGHFPGLGVWLAPGEGLHRAPRAADAAWPVAVALPFPAFNDGRSYSVARRLRLDGFPGDLYAYGDVLMDQARQMVRVGFTALELPDGTEIDALERALGAYADVYQPAADGLVAAGWRRCREAETGFAAPRPADAAEGRTAP